ncbi:MAG: hypothetical protein ABIY70_04950, partial [Capsulimonas sp.]
LVDALEWKCMWLIFFGVVTKKTTTCAPQTPSPLVHNDMRLDTYWLAARLAGGGRKPDLEKCAVKSPLIDHRFRYYQATLETPPSEEHLAMTAQQVCDELLRVYQESLAHFKALGPDPKSSIPGWPDGDTYDEAIKYSAFHVSYHTGQMYSVRHLLGDTTTDN